MSREEEESATCLLADVGFGRQAGDQGGQHRFPAVDDPGEAQQLRIEFKPPCGRCPVDDDTDPFASSGSSDHAAQLGKARDVRHGDQAPTLGPGEPGAEVSACSWGNEQNWQLLRSPGAAASRRWLCSA